MMSRSAEADNASSGVFFLSAKGANSIQLKELHEACAQLHQKLADDMTAAASKPTEVGSATAPFDKIFWEKSIEYHKTAEYHEKVAKIHADLIPYVDKNAGKKGKKS